MHRFRVLHQNAGSLLAHYWPAPVSAPHACVIVLTSTGSETDTEAKKVLNKVAIFFIYFLLQDMGVSP